MKSIQSISEKIFNIGVQNAPDNYLRQKVYVTNVTALILCIYGIPHLAFIWFVYPSFVTYFLVAFVSYILTISLNHFGFYTISRWLLILTMTSLTHYAHIILVQKNESLVDGLLVLQFMLVVLPALFFDKREKFQLVILSLIIFCSAVSSHLTKGWIELDVSIATDRRVLIQWSSYIGIIIYSIILYIINNATNSRQEKIIESLKQSESSLRIAQNLADIVYWEVDLDTLKARIGTKLLQNAGYQIKEDFIDIYIPEYRKKYLLPEDYEEAINLYERAAENKNNIGYETNATYRIKGINGDIYYHYCFVRVIVADGKPTLFVAVQDISKQQITLDSARERERLLRLSTKVGKISYWQIDEQDNITFGTEFLRNTGYDITENELTLPLKECTHFFCFPEDAEGINKLLKDNNESYLQHKETDFSYLHRLKGKDEKIYHHKSYGRTYFENGKRIIYGLTQDITEEQEYIHALRKNEASLKLSQQIAQIVYWEWVAETLTLHFDNQLLINAGFDLPPGQVTMSSSDYIQAYVHPEDRQKLFNSQADTQTKVEDPNAHIEITYRLLAPNGKIRYHNVVALNRYNDNKGVFFGIFQDVTERHEHIETLQKNEAALKLAQEMNKTVYWELNTETLLLEIDSRLLTLAGYDMPPGIMTIPIHDIIQNYIHPEDAPLMMDATAKALSRLDEPNSTFETTYRIVGAKGDIYYHHSVFNISQQTTKKILFGVTQDVTSQAMSEQQLLQNQKELLDSQRKAAEYQLAALRSQMNPHFIFNCLNSIQNFIAKNDKYNAINYLSKFAKLIRLILEGSKDNYIVLADEMKMLEYYIELEKMRFPDKFDFTMETDISLHSESLKIPPMLIQPFVENAILHGLVHKKDKGQLTIRFSNQSDNFICQVIDNGVGREEAERIKASKTNTHKSVAIHLTKERLEKHHRNFNGSLELKIIDMADSDGKGSGTMVEISLPLK